ncbi:DUF3572 domain-containing protein [Hoeflea sp. CAU 1731]
MGNEQSMALCADILTWISADEEMMSRFWALSGLTPETLRDAAAQPGFAAGVFDFLANHEPTLLAYCEDRQISPQTIVNAWYSENGGPPPGANP